MNSKWKKAIKKAEISQKQNRSRGSIKSDQIKSEGEVSKFLQSMFQDPNEVPDKSRSNTRNQEFRSTTTAKLDSPTHQSTLHSMFMKSYVANTPTHSAVNSQVSTNLTNQKFPPKYSTSLPNHSNNALNNMLTRMRQREQLVQEPSKNVSSNSQSGYYNEYAVNQVKSIPKIMNFKKLAAQQGSNSIDLVKSKNSINSINSINSNNTSQIQKLGKIEFRKSFFQGHQQLKPRISKNSLRNPPLPILPPTDTRPQYSGDQYPSQMNPSNRPLIEKRRSFETVNSRFNRGYNNQNQKLTSGNPTQRNLNQPYPTVNKIPLSSSIPISQAPPTPPRPQFDGNYINPSTIDSIPNGSTQSSLYSTIQKGITNRTNHNCMQDFSHRNRMGRSNNINAGAQNIFQDQQKQLNQVLMRSSYLLDEIQQNRRQRKNSNVVNNSKVPLSSRGQYQAHMDSLTDLHSQKTREEWMMDQLIQLSKTEPVKIQIIKILFKQEEIVDAQLLRKIKKSGRYMGAVTLGMIMFNLIDLFGMDMVKRQTHYGGFLYRITPEFKKYCEQMFTSQKLKN
jgi:hypothetical protein